MPMSAADAFLIGAIIQRCRRQHHRKDWLRTDLERLQSHLERIVPGAALAKTVEEFLAEQPANEHVASSFMLGDGGSVFTIE
jgi:hypothetical protein